MDVTLDLSPSQSLSKIVGIFLILLSLLFECVYHRLNVFAVHDTLPFRVVADGRTTPHTLPNLALNFATSCKRILRCVLIVMRFDIARAFRCSRYSSLLNDEVMRLSFHIYVRLIPRKSGKLFLGNPQAGE